MSVIWIKIGLLVPFTGDVRSSISCFGSRNTTKERVEGRDGVPTGIGVSSVVGTVDPLYFEFSFTDGLLDPFP